MKIAYDKNGLGFAELTALGLYHPIIWSLVTLLINYNLPKLGIKIARMVI